MDFKNLFIFLEDLQQNNHKDWMDENRKRYKTIREEYLDWLVNLDIELAEIDPDYYPTPRKKILNRINNNLLFHPNKPVYKDNFGAGLDKRPNTSDFYIHLGLNESFLAGGFYRPKPDFLKSIRDAIDYDGEVLYNIMNKPDFKKTFGGFIEDHALKTTPKGFPKDHRYIEILRQKSFAVMHNLSEKQIYAVNFKDHIKNVYLEMLPFRRYMNKAVTV